MKAHANIPIRILTHNIRYATDSPFKGEKPWPDRKSLLINELRYNTIHNPEAFICLQEVLHEQLLDILSGLNNHSSASTSTPKKDEWAYIGVGRDDGSQAGEYSPIFYRPSIWSLIFWKTFWLSPTPEKPGKGWDAASVRIVTVGTFRHVASKKDVVVLCTHFDDQGEVSRRESAKMIEGIVADATAAGDGERPPPVFLAGDLNSEMDGEAYQILNGEGSLLQDARGLAKGRYGHEQTFTGFGENEVSIIDFVFMGKKDWDVDGFSVLSNLFDDGVFSSDHRAVVVDAELEI
ncbi:hypothetical protein N0V94_003321 [Neodidymelliopsis sp. IMI 364377]|nr:hypothetical protein N0V94_003321 [Neodidymelliopsis sp. IMI 364377]